MGMYSTMEGTDISSANGLPNVSQYGWSAYEVSEFKQLIEYVDEAKRYAEEVRTLAEYVTTIKEAIDIIKADIDALLNQFNLDLTEIREMKTLIQGWYNQVEIWHNEVSSYRDEVVTIKEYLDALRADMILLHTQVTNMKNAAAISEANAARSASDSEKSAQDSHTYFERCYDLYLELSKGQVYRGVWNPHSGAYPNAKGTNSVWDVVLNEGEEEVVFDNKRWFWGDRLVYVVDSSEYFQVESGSNVKSVNGKTGAVILTYTDVNALPNSGLSVLNGKFSISSDSDFITLSNKTNGGASYIISKDIDRNIKWVIGQEVENTSDIVFRSYALGTQLTLQTDRILFNKDLYVNSDKVFTQGFLPTPSEIGSYSKQEIDATLTNYYLKTEVDTIADTKADKTFVTTELNKKVDKTTTINGKPLDNNIIITSDDTGSVKRAGDRMSGELIGINGRAFSTDYSTESLKHKAVISNEAGYSMLWRSNEDTSVKSSEFIGINRNSELIFRQDKGLGDGTYSDLKVFHKNFLPTPVELNVADVEETSTAFKLLSKRNETRTKEVQLFSKEGRLYSLTEDGTKVQFYNDRTYRPSLADVGGLGVENGNELNIPSTTSNLYINFRRSGPSEIEKVVFCNGKAQVGGLGDVVAKEYYAQDGTKRVFHQGFLPTTQELGVYSTNEIDAKVTEINTSFDQKIKSVQDLAFIYALIL